MHNVLATAVPLEDVSWHVNMQLLKDQDLKGRFYTR